MQAKVRNALKLYRRPTTSATIEMRLHRAVLYNSIYHSDDQLLVGQHAFSLQAASAPVLHLTKTASNEMSNLYLKSFDQVWRLARQA